jgi:hypothetical protein
MPMCRAACERTNCDLEKSISRRVAIPTTHRHKHHERSRRVQRNRGGRLHARLARERFDCAVLGRTHCAKITGVTWCAQIPVEVVLCCIILPCCVGTSRTSTWIEAPAVQREITGHRFRFCGQTAKPQEKPRTAASQLWLVCSCHTSSSIHSCMLHVCAAIRETKQTSAITCAFVLSVESLTRTLPQAEL